MRIMRSEKRGTRVQFRLRTMLWGTMWFALLLAICIRHQAAATRQREVLETLRARRMMPAPAGGSRAVTQPAMLPSTVSANPS
jgi:hypothetical protein